MQHRLYRFLKKAGIQRAINWTARCDGVAVPLLGNVGAEALAQFDGPSWKPAFFRRLRAVAGDPAMLDVGANVGQTLLQYRRSGPLTAPYFAFEPNPVCVRYLVKLIEINRFAAVQLFPVALSSIEGCPTLALGREDDPAASVLPEFRDQRQVRARHRVPCFRLDFLVGNAALSLPPGFLMKIDVEGAEADVLEGAMETIRTLRPAIQCEVLWARSDETLRAVTENNRRIESVLRALRYRLFRLQLDTAMHRILALEEVSALPTGIYQRGINSHECEYLFAPAEGADRIRAALLPV